MTIAERTEPTPTRARLHRRFPGARVLSDGTVLYWWVEVGLILAFYLVYSAIRNTNEGSTPTAFDNAVDIIDFQRLLGLDVERTLQQWALHIKPLIIACNYFYGSLHFVVTGAVLVFLYRKWAEDYPLWRNALGVATGIALIGFMLFPLMPPRLLPGSFGYVDTLAKYPTFWTFNSGAASEISNQYAAMPSVHCAWALWCACVLVPRVRSRWAKALAVAYPVATVTAIVLTANHYLVDAIAGFTVLGIGYVTARAVTRAGRRTPAGRFDARSVSASRAAAAKPADDRAELSA